MTDLQSANLRPTVSPAMVTLIIPCRAEYVSVARLAVLGIASRMPFSYDEVEDVRLAVGEACTHAVERALQAPEGNYSLTISSEVSASNLSIQVSDDVPQYQQAERDELPDGELDHPELGALLMEILVDKVEVVTGSSGTTVTLTKLAPRS